MAKKKSRETSLGHSDKQLDGASVDWELANTAAADWARVYGFELVDQISASTQARLQREIAAFVENGENMGQLRTRLEPLFGAERADLIASTEVTRAYAEGNLPCWLIWAIGPKFSKAKETGTGSLPDPKKAVG